MIDLEAKREQIKQLHIRYARGDLKERSFQQTLIKASVELYRGLVEQLVAKDEKIQEEHHVILAHNQLTKSVLKETEQQAISFFATSQKLWRVRAALKPGQITTGDDQDQTQIDHIAFQDINLVQMYKQIRIGEIMVSLVMIAIAILFRAWLSITGPLLILIGGLGILHGSLLPTRWVQIKIRGEELSDPFKIYAIRKKSAKKLIKLIKQSYSHATCP